MRFVKFALFGLVLFGLWSGWDRRADVIDAYTESAPEQQTEIRLSGLDLTIAKTKIEPSPFVVQAAPDTRRRPIALLFTDEGGDEAEVAMFGGRASLSGHVKAPIVQEPDPSPHESSSSGLSNRNGRNRTSGATTSTTSPSAIPLITLPPGTKPPSTQSSGTQSSGTQPPATQPSSTQTSGTQTPKTSSPGAGSATTPGTDPASPTAATSSAAGGIVRLERFTSEGVGIREVPIDADGSWSATGLLGGRYRIRAWVPGRFTSGPPEITFLNAEANEVVNFNLVGVDSTLSVQFHDAGSFYEDMSGSVGFTVTSEAVDENGIIVTGPVSGLDFSVSIDGVYSFETSSVQRTNSNGAVIFNLRCHTPGVASMVAIFNGRQRSYALPACIRAPSTVPLTVPPRSDDSQPPNSTKASSPSTTRPPVNTKPTPKSQTTTTRSGG